MNTPPANRQPVQTELHTFNESIIREAIYREIARGGQVFFVHNRVSNLGEIAVRPALMPRSKRWYWSWSNET